MSDEFDLNKARKIASEEAEAAVQKREGSIEGHRDAVRVFHRQILTLRKANHSWELIAQALERWCGRKIPANTVKTYTSMVNMGTLAPWPAHELGEPVALLAQVGKPPAEDVASAELPALPPLPGTHQNPPEAPAEVARGETSEGGGVGSAQPSPEATGKKPGFAVKPDPSLKRNQA